MLADRLYADIFWRMCESSESLLRSVLLLNTGPESSNAQKSYQKIVSA